MERTPLANFPGLPPVLGDRSSWLSLKRMRLNGDRGESVQKNKDF